MQSLDGGNLGRDDPHPQDAKVGSGSAGELPVHPAQEVTPTGQPKERFGGINAIAPSAAPTEWRIQRHERSTPAEELTTWPEWRREIIARVNALTSPNVIPLRSDEFAALDALYRQLLQLEYDFIRRFQDDAFIRLQQARVQFDQARVQLHLALGYQLSGQPKTAGNAVRLADEALASATQLIESIQARTVLTRLLRLFPWRSDSAPSTAQLQELLRDVAALQQILQVMRGSRSPRTRVRWAESLRELEEALGGVWRSREEPKRSTRWFAERLAEVYGVQSTLRRQGENGHPVFRHAQLIEAAYAYGLANSHYADGDVFLAERYGIEATDVLDHLDMSFTTADNAGASSEHFELPSDEERHSAANQLKRLLADLRSRLNKTRGDQ